jgi:predicted permease
VNRPDEVRSYEDADAIMRDETRTGYADFRVADAGYFRAMGIPLVRGRLFAETDAPDASHVAVISESLAKARWPNEDPLGKLINFAGIDGDMRVFTIVGIVGDVRDRGLDAPPQPTFYGNSRQRVKRTSRYTYVMHGAFDPAAVISSARATLRELDPTVPPTFRTMEQVVSSTLSDRRFNLLLLGVFGGAALALAVTGIYGVISYLVAQQTREIGIRVALGAQRNQVMRMVVGRGVRLTAVGVAVGIVAALWLTRLIGGLLFGVGRTDPLTFAGISALLLGATALASYIPARRATRVDPMVALRSE